MRQLEILRAINEGANTYASIVPRSSYEHISNVRRICGEMVRAGYLETWKARKPQAPRNFSPWGHGPSAAHFRLSALGAEHLIELERQCVSLNVGTAS